MKWILIICIGCSILMSCASSHNGPAKRLTYDDTYRDVSTDLTTRLKSFAGVTVFGVRARAKISIRGVNSIMNQSPLFILDDRPMASYADLYSMVNTSEIKKIEVLKNPVDLALYGFRGANGVVRVTTDPS